MAVAPSGRPRGFKLLLGWIPLRYAPTLDEPVHLTAGIYHLQSGRFDLDRGNTPLVKLATALPVMLAGPETDWHRMPDAYHVAMDFMQVNGRRSLWLIAIGRVLCMSFSLLGAYVCLRWAQDLYGFGAGMTALLLWCTSPFILGNGALIKGDVPATAVGVAACYAFWKWLREPTLGRAVGAGCMLGLAEVTKFACVIFYVLWPVLWIVWYCGAWRKRNSPRVLRRTQPAGKTRVVQNLDFHPLVSRLAVDQRAADRHAAIGALFHAKLEAKREIGVLPCREKVAAGAFRADQQPVFDGEAFPLGPPQLPALQVLAVEQGYKTCLLLVSAALDGTGGAG